MKEWGFLMLLGLSLSIAFVKGVIVTVLSNLNQTNFREGRMAE